MKPEDSRMKRHMWAPGGYLCKCSVCKEQFAGDKRATMCADCTYKDWKPTHRHVKTGGIYQVLQRNVIAEATNTLVVVYEGVDGRVWVRDQTEFYDGRFVDLPSKPVSGGISAE